MLLSSETELEVNYTDPILLQLWRYKLDQNVYFTVENDRNSKTISAARKLNLPMKNFVN